MSLTAASSSLQSCLAPVFKFLGCCRDLPAEPLQDRHSAEEIISRLGGTAESGIAERQVSDHTRLCPHLCATPHANVAGEGSASKLEGQVFQPDAFSLMRPRSAQRSRRPASSSSITGLSGAYDCGRINCAGQRFLAQRVRLLRPKMG